MLQVFHSFEDWPASMKWQEAINDGMKSPRGVQGLKGKPYKKWLRSLGLFSLDETEERPHCSFIFLVRGIEGAGTDLFICDDL